MGVSTLIKTVQVLVKLPDRLLQRMDKIVLEEGYASRQEFIRELIREKIRAGARVELEEEVFRRRRVRVTSRGHPSVQPPKVGCQAGAATSPPPQTSHGAIASCRPASCS